MTAITITDLNNAKLDVDHIAEIATSLSATATDRLGHSKLTAQGAVDTIKLANPRGAWAPITVYATKDLASNGGTWYLCVVEHTSSAAFATDTATKWRIYQGATTAELSATDGASLVGYIPSAPGSVPTTVLKQLLLHDIFTRNDIQMRKRPLERSINFDNFLPRSTPSMVQLTGAATASININQQFEVLCNYSTVADRCTLDGFDFHEGKLRFAVVKGPFMIRLLMPDNTSRAIWSASGTDIEVGSGSAINALISILTCAMKGTVIGTDVVWVELITGASAGSGGFNVRSWVDGATYPTSFDAGSLWGSALAGHNDGVLSLASIDGVAPAKFVAFQVLDIPNALGQATFIGRWFSRFDGKISMTTIRGGDRFRFRVTGTPLVYVRVSLADGVVSGIYPYVDVYLNGAHNRTIQMSPGASVLIDSLDRGQVSYVECRVRGVHEHNDKWLKGAGLMIESLYAMDHTYPYASLAPWEDPRPRILFIGDSITEGIVSRSSPSTPINSGGDLSWPVLVSDMRGLSPILNGFGGTRLTGPSTGSGNVPEAWVHSFYYMDGRAIDTQNEYINFIIINLGTNDGGAGVAGETFESAYKAFLIKLLKKFPTVKKVWAMRPFSGFYAANISSAVTYVNDARVAYMDTSSWTGITYTDGTHPDLAGHTTIANYCAAAMSDLQ